MSKQIKTLIGSTQIIESKGFIGNMYFLVKRDTAPKGYIQAWDNLKDKSKQVNGLNVYEDGFTIDIASENFSKHEHRNIMICEVMTFGKNSRNKQKTRIAINKDYFDYFVKNGYTFRISENMISQTYLNFVQLIKNNEVSGIVLPIRID